MLYIETARLIIRPLEAKDAETLARIWTDPEVTRHMGGPRIFDEVRNNLLEDAVQPAPPRFDLWPLVEKVTGRIVGHCGLLDKDVDGRPEIELVYVLSKEVWGKDMLRKPRPRCGTTHLRIRGFSASSLSMIPRMRHRRASRKK